MAQSTNGVAEKTFDKEAFDRSVQDLPPGQGPFLGNTQIFFAASRADEIEPWGRNVKLRDAQLREFIPAEPLFASALGTVCSRNAAFGWKIEGPEAQAKEATDLLQTANFGKGWADFVLRLSIDLYCQDNGAFFEIIREADNPEAKSIGIANLDAARCYHTGIPATPVLYIDRNMQYHLLKWYQVASITEMPATWEGLPGLQYCALTRLLARVQTMRDVNIYLKEKIGGRNPRSVTLVKGVSADSLSEAFTKMGLTNDAAGLMRFSNPLFVSSINPTADIGFETYDMASIPDGFTLEEQSKWYITLIAMAFLSDYQEFAPLPGGGLGTASQSETQHKKSQGKGPAIFQKQITQALNWNALPEAVEFSYAEDDLDAELAAATGAEMRAKERGARITSTELTPEIARKRALASGDLTQDEYDELVKQAEELKKEQEAQAEAQLEAMAQAQPVADGDETVDDDGKPFAQHGKNDEVMRDAQKHASHDQSTHGRRGGGGEGGGSEVPEWPFPPLIIDGELREGEGILDGFRRYAIAKERGWPDDEIPTVDVRDVFREQGLGNFDRMMRDFDDYENGVMELVNEYLAGNEEVGWTLSPRGDLSVLPQWPRIRKEKAIVSLKHASHDQSTHGRSGGGGGGSSDHATVIDEWGQGGSMSYAAMRDPGTPEGLRFTEAIDTLPDHKGLIYRGMHVEDPSIMKDFRVGSEYTLALHSSASQDIDVAKDFMSGAAGDDFQVLLIVNSRTARDVNDYIPEEYRGTREVVMRANTRYRVDQTKYTEEGGVEIALTEL